MKSIVLLFLLMPVFGWSQNLVPNPSFEEYEECPFATGDFPVMNWTSWQETPDYFNSCNNDLTGWVGVPENVWGYQNPISGDGYVSLATYANYAPNIREYIAVPLNQPLAIGQEYRVFFYTSLYDGGVKNESWCASNHIGLRFFKDPIFNNIDNPLQPDNFVHLDYSLILANSDSWTLVEGWFVADDNYNWLAIGNFFDGENTEVDTLNASENCVAYYYVENVCVSSNSDDCDNLLMAKEQMVLSTIEIFPNPTTDYLTIKKGSNSNISINIYDGLGELICSTNTKQQITTFDLSEKARGLYFIYVRDESLNIQKFKIIKL